MMNKANIRCIYILDRSSDDLYHHHRTNSVSSLSSVSTAGSSNLLPNLMSAEVSSCPPDINRVTGYYGGYSERDSSPELCNMETASIGSAGSSQASTNVLQVGN